MDCVIQTPFKYVPSVLLGVFIGISLTVFVTFEERFPPVLNRNWSPRIRFELVRSVDSAPPSSLDTDTVALKTLNETKEELKDIRNFVTTISERVSTPQPYKGNGSLIDTIKADQLNEKVRVLCWILTYPDNHQTKAIHAKNTWGRRCTKFLIMSTARDDSLGTIALNVTETRENLWGKTKRALQYIHKHHLQDADWFYKADDDTYSTIENMRYFLSRYSSRDPIFFGYKLKAIVRQGYMSGGAGYVMSKTALVRFVKDALPDTINCSPGDNGAEDAEVGRCLENVHIYAGDTRDSLGRGRFFLQTPEFHLRYSDLDPTYWYWTSMYYESDEGLDCCSNTAISWHYITPPYMHLFDYFLYTFKTYGRFTYFPQSLPKKVNFTAVAFQLQQEMPSKIYSYFT